MAKNKRKYWITTDTHLGHYKLTEICSRPENFSDLIIKRWKTKVAPEDWVIHLGDLCWPDYYDQLKDLPGHKILVRGNHDTKSNTWYENRGFDLVCERLVMKLEGLKILFTHEPVIFHDQDINIHGHLHNMEHRIYSQIAENYGFDDNDLLMCARYCVSLEQLGYDVHSMSYIIGLAKKQMIKDGFLEG